MKWIAIVILLIIGPYTYLRWHYRKPQPAFQPYHDMKNQANTERLLSAGFQRITLEPERPADPLRNIVAAPVRSTAGGLPEALASTLMSKPVLPAEIRSVTAASESNTLFAYPIEFTCALPDNKQQVVSAYLYLRDELIYVVPDFERISGELLARSRENIVRVTVPAGSLKPGTYTVSLIADRNAQTWALSVK